MDLNVMAFQLSRGLHLFPYRLYSCPLQVNQPKSGIAMKHNFACNLKTPMLRTSNLESEFCSPKNGKKSMKSILPFCPIQFGSRSASVKAAASGLTPEKGPNAIQRLVLLLTNLFPLWVAAGGALGFFHPTALAWMTSERITASLAITMLCMGMTLELDDFKRVLKNPRQVLFIEDHPPSRIKIFIASRV
jgi:hypothetical protein